MKFFAKIKKETQIYRNWWYERRVSAILHDIVFTFDTTTKEYVSKELDPAHIKIASQYPSYIKVEMISGMPAEFSIEKSIQEDKKEEDKVLDKKTLSGKEDILLPKKPTSRKKLTIEDQNV